jgi:hypothetical protein
MAGSDALRAAPSATEEGARRSLGEFVGRHLGVNHTQDRETHQGLFLSDSFADGVKPVGALHHARCRFQHVAQVQQQGQTRAWKGMQRGVQ